MSDDPKPKPEQRVPSFDELRGPKRPGIQDPGPEEKTAQISPELLRKALQQSAAAEGERPRSSAPPEAAREAAASPTRNTAPVTNTSPTVQQRAIQPPAPRVPPPPPGGKPATAAPAPAAPPPAVGTGGPWNPTAATAPVLPIVKVPPPPPGGTSGPRRPATERMEPVTPDAIPGPRSSGSRAAAPVQVDAPARPDPSLHQTQLSSHHQTEFISEPTPSAPTVLEGRPLRAPAPPPPTTQVTQPNVENPFHSRRAEEPPSGERVAVPISENTVTHNALGAVPEPPTRNERSSIGKRGAAAMDIEADILSEVHKLQATTDPGLGPGAGREPATGKVELVEVLARPASVPRRLIAYSIDALLLAAVDVLVAAGVMAIGRPAPLAEGLGVLDQLAMRAHDSPKLVITVVVLCVLLATAYTAGFAVALSGRTPGRLVAGLRLVTKRGGPPSTTRAVVRALLALVSFALGLSGFWLGLFDRRAQTLHDMLCSTFVVRLGPTRT